MQSTGAVFTQDPAFRQHVTQLLHAIITAAPAAAAQQVALLLRLLLPLRANTLLAPDLDVSHAQKVNLATLQGHPVISVQLSVFLNVKTQ